MDSNGELEFRPLTLADKDMYCEYRGRNGAEICWHAFPCLMMWSVVMDVSIAESDGCAVLMYKLGDGLFFSVPFGSGDRRAAVLKLRRHCETHGLDLSFASLSRSQRDWLVAEFPGEFLVEENAAYADYIYRRDDLATLKGTKYQKKRNHIHRFEAAGDWSYEPVTAANLADCMAIRDVWREAKSSDPDADHESIARESKVLDFALEHFDELGLFGGILIQKSKPVAFAIGSRINDEMVDVNFEKAMPGVDGAYAKVSQQFAEKSCAGFSFMDREDDANDPGLRKAKRSLHPVRMGEKFSATLSDVTYATASDRPAITALWREAFGDPQEFIDKFFELEFTDETMLTIRENGEIVSMAAMIPATVVTSDAETPARYVYALATAKRKRGKGLAARILEFASRHYKVPLILLPEEKSVADFYAKAGFTPMASKNGDGRVRWPARHVAFANSIGQAESTLTGGGMARFPQNGEHPDFSGVMLSLTCG